MSKNLEIINGIAAGFVGVYESPPSSNNVIFNTHYYNREVSGSVYPWCAVFVWDVFRMAGLSHLYYGGKKTASCAAVLNYAKSTGKFVTGPLRRGDIVLYKFDRTAAAANHIGIVQWADSKSLRAVEGNTSQANDVNGGSVLIRTRNYDNVVGGYRPDYGIDEEDKMLTYEEFEGYMERYLSILDTGEDHSPWAAAAIDQLREKGIVAGGTRGDFGWKKPITKETVAQMLSNLINREDTNDR